MPIYSTNYILYILDMGIFDNSRDEVRSRPIAHTPLVAVDGIVDAKGKAESAGGGEVSTMSTDSWVNLRLDK